MMHDMYHNDKPTPLSFWGLVFGIVVIVCTFLLIFTLFAQNATYVGKAGELRIFEPSEQTQG